MLYLTVASAPVNDSLGSRSVPRPVTVKVGGLPTVAVLCPDAEVVESSPPVTVTVIVYEPAEAYVCPPVTVNAPGVPLTAATVPAEVAEPSPQLIVAV